jgi:hypothetical protein
MPAEPSVRVFAVAAVNVYEVPTPKNNPAKLGLTVKVTVPEVPVK